MSFLGLQSRAVNSFLRICLQSEVIALGPDCRLTLHAPDAAALRGTGDASR
jgi:hypothetical protein